MSEQNSERLARHRELPPAYTEFERPERRTVVKEQVAHVHRRLAERQKH